MDAPPVTPAPPVVTWLGYGGLLPFIFLMLASLLDSRYMFPWRDALFAYGAVILSFVGALHWGFAMTLRELSAAQRNASFVWSVVPALLAWPALLMGSLGASLLLVAGFVANYWQDRALARMAHLPEWYLPLRLRLTTVACMCLLAAGLVG